MDDDGALGFLGEGSQMPGILALLEKAILNHAAPIISVKDHKGITDWAIGQVDGAIGSRDTVVPAAHDHGVDGLSFVIASMRVLRVLRIPIAIGGRQSLNTDQLAA